ncbi:hypothetical protein AZE42_06161 [Rhizopogon vesiculosus]|uniref:Uncharacterized protein n=1 Tax=Rhizopogon vesiculosus TaxID=180088 RepID=A0A1J8QXN0_9AGAM|nr:hypothetical protein AZE42_06161 [Rhizopogon vesiculosus]
MLYLESILKADPNFDHETFPLPMTYAFEWLLTKLRLGQLDFKYCHDPERRPQVPFNDDVAHLESGGYDDGEEDEDVCVILVLSVFSDDPESFNARSTQAQIDLLTNLLGSPPQWWQRPVVPLGKSWRSIECGETFLEGETEDDDLFVIVVL